LSSQAPPEDIATLSTSLSSDGHAPIVLTCPVPAGDQALEIGPLSDPALDELIGPPGWSLLLRSADPAGD
jgi:hypothetical protein